METLLILAAAAVAVLALAAVSVASAQTRRPPLRTQREQDIADRFADGDVQALAESIRPVPASPIDRAAPILDAWAIEAALIEGQFIEGQVVERRIIDQKVDDEPDDAPKDGSAEDASRDGDTAGASPGTPRRMAR